MSVETESSVVEDTLSMSSFASWTYRENVGFLSKKVIRDQKTLEVIAMSLVNDTIERAVEIVKSEQEDKTEPKRPESGRSNISVSSLKKIKEWDWRDVIPDTWMTRTWLLKSRTEELTELSSIKSYPSTAV